MLPKKIYLNYSNEDAGRPITWSDKPVFVPGCDIQNYEYIDLSQVWHSASEEPKCKELLIVYCDDIGGIPIDTVIYPGRDAFPWEEVVKIYSIIYWAYAKDLLPKGGEK